MAPNVEAEAPHNNFDVRIIYVLRRARIGNAPIPALRDSRPIASQMMRANGMISNHSEKILADDWLSRLYSFSILAYVISKALSLLSPFELRASLLLLLPGSWGLCQKQTLTSVFKSQTSHLILRRLRALGVFAELLPCTTKINELTWKPKGIVFSGGMDSLDTRFAWIWDFYGGLTELLGPSSVYDEGAPRKIAVS